MSTTSRLLSGSLSNWVKIGVTFIARLVLVPVYLSYWTPEVYGIWISIEAFISIVTTISRGHQDYLGFEFLKFGINNRRSIASYLWSGCIASFTLGLIELLIIGAIIWSGSLDIIVGESGMATDIAIVLLLQGVAWLLSGNIGGLFVRVLHPFGYYPRMGWWGVWKQILTTSAPLIAVVLGADLLMAGVALAISNVVYYMPLFYDQHILLKKEKIWGSGKTTLSMGFKNLIYSMALSGKQLLESLRHQGVRVVLAPLSGASGVAAFSTMRTGANVVMQGLNTITNPLMPELMRFLNQKDQERTEVAFGTVWFVIILFSPAVVVLQVVIEPLYTLWTRGTLDFNPLLFAVLSLGVLVYGLAQPAIAVARGNNLLKPQLVISILAGTTVVGGMVLLVPLMGILGAGIALLLSELIALCCYLYVTKRWLENRGMKWPAHLFSETAITITVASVAMVMIVWLPIFWWVTLLISLPLFVWNIKRYWNALPQLAKEHAQVIMKRLPLIGRII